ncbi:hypothetical protein [Candidatus Sororendozoicomonas aggregata]|uniref:hypothetical protein n=1 Tax=Candidatus Sororendozoicomonas aggregata TaxID=3073239 RepID=UPI002ED05BD7
MTSRTKYACFFLLFLCQLGYSQVFWKVTISPETTVYAALKIDDIDIQGKNKGGRKNGLSFYMPKNETFSSLLLMSLNEEGINDKLGIISFLAQLSGMDSAGGYTNMRVSELISESGSKSESEFELKEKNYSVKLKDPENKGKIELFSSEISNAKNPLIFSEDFFYLLHEKATVFRKKSSAILGDDGAISVSVNLLEGLSLAQSEAEVADTTLKVFSPFLTINQWLSNKEDGKSVDGVDHFAEVKVCDFEGLTEVWCDSFNYYDDGKERTLTIPLGAPGILTFTKIDDEEYNAFLEGFVTNNKKSKTFSPKSKNVTPGGSKHRRTPSVLDHKSGQFIPVGREPFRHPPGIDGRTGIYYYPPADTGEQLRYRMERYYHMEGPGLDAYAAGPVNYPYAYQHPGSFSRGAVTGGAVTGNVRGSSTGNRASFRPLREPTKQNPEDYSTMADPSKVVDPQVLNTVEEDVYKGGGVSESLIADIKRLRQTDSAAPKEDTILEGDESESEGATF